MNADEPVPNEFALLSHPDPLVAKPAFDKAWSDVARPLVGWLRNQGNSPDRCEDISQDAAKRLWAARTKLDIPGRGAWWRLVRRVAINIAIDGNRKDGGNIFQSLEDDIPDEDLRYLDLLLEALEDIERLYQLADDLWLGKLDEDDGVDAVLAAKLYYVHRVPISEIQRKTGISTQQLDRWLTSGPALTRLAFLRLYFCNDDLTGFIFDPGSPLPPGELDRLTEEARSRGQNPPPGWTWDQVAVAMWRVRNGLKTEEILHFKRCRFSPAQLEKTYLCFQARYPYATRAEQLRQRFGEADQISHLRATGLWRRIVFSCHAADGLPYKQILERTTPAIDKLDTRLTHAMLTGWIGMGRLFSQLAAAYEEATYAA